MGVSPKAAGVLIAAVLGAAAVAAPLVVEHEGWLPGAYRDPVGVITACAGVTGGGVAAGRVYTDAECVSLTAQALATHGAEIAGCLPGALPQDVRAAFISFAYNVGSAKFCASTLASKARAGELAGACAELSRWTYAGGRRLPGLVRRRAAERALCERALKP